MNKQECIKRIKSKELKKDKIPEKFLNDEEVIINAIDAYDGLVCEYMGKQLKANKKLAKEVFKRKYGYALEFFSENVKNDFECCKASIIEGISGYRYIGEKQKDNKELALLEINNGLCDVREIPKKLRKDKEIVGTYWKKMYSTAKDMWCAPGFFCSIVAIDDFGNEIIDEFKKEEYKRHTQERIDKYEERTEEVQFIKCKNNKLEHELFRTILNPLIIIIGSKKNKLAEDIISNYYNENDTAINIIEIYETNVETHNFTLITKEVDYIINFLRFITYTTANDSFLTEDNLSDIIGWFTRKDLANNNIEVHKMVLNSEIQDFKIEQTEPNAKLVILQIASNNRGIEVYKSNTFWKKIYKQFGTDNIELHIHDSLNIPDIELYWVTLNKNKSFRDVKEIMSQTNRWEKEK